MSLVAKHYDPVFGVDIHLIITPVGVVIPVPHPFVGMVMDLFDYVPALGSNVYVNGRLRGAAGTGVRGIPHFPIGGMFVMPPTNDGDIFMGSSTVLSEGEPLSRSGELVLTCQSIGMPTPLRTKPRRRFGFYLPTSTVLPIPSGPPVMVGGPSTVSMAALAIRGGIAGARGGLARFRRFQRGSKWWAGVSERLNRRASGALDRLGSKANRARNGVKRAVCTLTGHPVDVATGKVLTDHVDFELPGPIPLRWERVWFSTSTHAGPLGHGWHHPYDQELVADAETGTVAVRLEDGRTVAFPAVPRGTEAFDRRERLTLRHDEVGYALEDSEGLIRRFGVVSGREAHVLTEVANRCGESLRFRYDARGYLSEIRDSGRRRLRVTCDDAGRVLEIVGPHPTDPASTTALVRYRYASSGNLIEVRDALDQALRYDYDGHLLTRETDRNGLSFQFAYDGRDEHARCHRTWGDGGIYDHELRYDDAQSLTVVKDSTGAETRYFHEGGVVVRVVDPLGHTHLTEFNEFGQPTAEIDPLGHETRYAYDERGDRVQTIGPDGAKLEIAYRDGRPVTAVDPAGGSWAWSHDELGRVSDQIDPLGVRMRYEYAGSLVTAVVDPEGCATRFGYDPARNLASMITPDGQRTTWKYDALGRCLETADPRGASVRRRFDAVGRLVRVEEPDGNLKVLDHDPEGNVVRARDHDRDVRFCYAGLGRLVARTENDTRVRFVYDTEERLVAIENEHGAVYRFERDASGEVVVESGFDGVTRRYVRDAAGRVTTMERPGGLETALRHDAAGRLLEAEHSDGTRERFAWRSDGELLEAENATGVVRFERDPFGRVLREYQGEHVVRSRYDARGFRTGLDSSLGADLTFERNAMGDVERITANNGEAVWESVFQRDALGFEIGRSLPGGVRTRWQRDQLGRPVRQEIATAARVLRTREYTWAPGHRLRQISDSRFGTSTFTHDAAGNLAGVTHADGSFDYRMPDAVGNLFRTKDRSDRTFGPAGQLLESRDAQGRVTRYAYDAEGNLVSKTAPDGRAWSYHWNASGHLERVERPDGATVTFTYDALARRVSKTFRGRTTRWVWDGNDPLHEWVEGQELDAVAPPDPAAVAADVSKARRAEETALTPATGPPVTTWVFESEFTPAAWLEGSRARSIVTDHIGSPVAVYEGATPVWEASHDADAGCTPDPDASVCCPFRFPGQYEDTETGLCYNRFRYYDPEAGHYISQDPLGLEGGLNAHAYVQDPLVWADPMGLMPKPTVHGNSAASTRVQHRYEIVDMDKGGDVVKTGISGQPLNENGTSPRANPQVSRLNKDAGRPRYRARVVEPSIANRVAALDAERAATNRLASEGHSLRLQKRPKPCGK